MIKARLCNIIVGFYEVKFQFIYHGSISALLLPKNDLKMYDFGNYYCIILSLHLNYKYIRRHKND